MDSAPGYGPGGWGFESLQVHKCKKPHKAQKSPKQPKPLFIGVLLFFTLCKKTSQNMKKPRKTNFAEQLWYICGTNCGTLFKNGKTNRK